MGIGPKTISMMLTVPKDTADCKFSTLHVNLNLMEQQVLFRERSYQSSNINHIENLQDFMGGGEPRLILKSKSRRG